ncbi:hypothetical protein C497_01125 [Halalkalicoccus jeotgali B3]|uniref:Uncharacterized protein n=1 Tax=Halalkalicoccus jeotgali (strain DSM 18796 / CECT 7217 / JCM 14584 / KCTC 4019 / B3) TaxID=795797 RepID=L9VWC2_HALJB|nr:hypothetical protein C497_01125 [Halalkalicoccus jeotgali B3]
MAIGFCELAGIVPGALTAEDIAVLTESDAVEPSLSPPGWVVPLVWNVLYALMGVALYLVWRDARRTPAGKIGRRVFRRSARPQQRVVVRRLRLSGNRWTRVSRWFRDVRSLGDRGRYDTTRVRPRQSPRSSPPRALPRVDLVRYCS